jgi:uncharacterized protein YqeY
MTQLRNRVNAGLKDAMRNRETDRVCTLRLINAAIKDRDIATRTEGATEGATDADVLQILDKMVRQRQESARAYEEGGRLELAEKERAEIVVLEEFMPRRLSDQEVDEAIDHAVFQTGAQSIRDMGKVMGVLKTRYAGQMDFGSVGPKVRERLSAERRA